MKRNRHFRIFRRLCLCVAMSNSEEQRATLHLASALAELSEVKTTPGQSVDDLPRSVVAERIPNFAGFPYEEGLLSCGALAALLPNFRVRSDSEGSRLKKDHDLLHSILIC